MSVRKPTRAETLRHALEEEILAGRLRPGERLEETALAERFGVSRTPVRETLRQLTASGLVEMRPRKGAVVAALTALRLMEMFEMMAELEALCAGLAARRMSKGELAHLAGTLDACARVADGGSVEAYYGANVAFHEAIYAGSHNGVLEETTTALRNRTEPFRRRQLGSPGRVAESLAEHRAVVEAIAAGRSEEAARLMRRHVTVQASLFADFMSLLNEGEAR